MRANLLLLGLTLGLAGCAAGPSEHVWPPDDGPFLPALNEMPPFDLDNYTWGESYPSPEACRYTSATQVERNRQAGMSLDYRPVNIQVRKGETDWLRLEFLTEFEPEGLSLEIPQGLEHLLDFVAGSNETHAPYNMTTSPKRTLFVLEVRVGFEALGGATLDAFVILDHERTAALEHGSCRGFIYRI